MSVSIPLCGGGLLAITGLIGTVWPGVMYALDSENDQTIPPTPKQLRSTRITSLVILLLALALIYAILTWDGKPADGPLF